LAYAKRGFLRLRRAKTTHVAKPTFHVAFLVLSLAR
jgi:hypothetical protein